MDKKMIKNTVLHYIGEIIVVVIGIIIAIQLNLYYDNKKTLKNEKNSLTRVASDLNSEKILLKNFKDDIKYSIIYLKGVTSDKKNQDLDSIYFHLRKVYIHYKFNPEYINLKYSGNLNLISNEKLRYNLTKYYELKYPFYKEISEQHKDFFTNEIQKYMSQNPTPNRTDGLVTKKSLEKHLKDEKFIDLVNSQINYLNWIEQSLNINEIDYIIEMIEKP